MSKTSHETSGGVLVVIGAFKLLKAALLIAVAIGVHKLLHKDVAEQVRQWAHAVRIDPQSHYLNTLLSKLTGVSDKRLRELSIATFCYAGIFLIEGVGLLMRKRWAEYFTVISTGGLLPLEIWEIVRRVTPVRLAVLVINLVIVIYLIVRIYRTRPGRRREARLASGTP